MQLLLVLRGFIAACGLLFGFVHGAPKSIAFVIDTTGSMSEDIRGAITGSEEIFRSMIHEDNDIKNFVLVPFNDPGDGPVTSTTSTDEFLAALEGLTANGGDDCPELAMHGIQLAIKAVYPRSTIFVFTDASAKDYAMEPTILNEIQEKQCQLIYVLTGMCGPATDPGYEVYGETAAASNGHAFNVTPGDVSDVIHYVEAHYHEVAIESLDFPSPAARQISFPTDSHLAGFAISISGNAPQLTLYNPSGNPISNYSKTVNLTNAVVASYNNTEPGMWKVETKVASGPYSVRITGIGFLDYDYGFSQNENSPNPDYRPLVGVETYIFGKLSNLTDPGRAQMLHIVDMDGTELSNATLTYRSGYEYQYVAGPVVTPSSLFRMKIVGNDEQNFAFQRITSTAVSAESNPCVVVNCNGHGTCAQLNGSSYVCHCNPGYDGHDCYYENQCYLFSPCVNGASCIQNGNDYSCSCTAGYSGKNCSQEALLHPCNGHGTFTCTCDRGYTGNTCNQYVDWCKQPVVTVSGSATSMNDLCKPHGTCVSSTQGATCACNAGFSGQFCDNEVANKTWLGFRCTQRVTHQSREAGLQLCPTNEHCVPDDLDCFYEECSFPIGWCLPRPYHPGGAYMRDDEIFAAKLLKIIQYAKKNGVTL